MALTISALHRQYLAHIEDGERLGEAQNRLVDERKVGDIEQKDEIDALQEKMIVQFDLAVDVRTKIAELPALNIAEILIKLQHLAGGELMDGSSQALLESAIRDLESFSGIPSLVSLTSSFPGGRAWQPLSLGNHGSVGIDQIDHGVF